VEGLYFGPIKLSAPRTEQSKPIQIDDDEPKDGDGELTQE